MAIQNLEYWYDGQQRRFLEQLVRAFSGFQYQTGWNANGAPQLMMVPCTMANTNKQVANIISNNSQNTLQTAPQITIWQTGLIYRRADQQNPFHVDTRQVTERGVDFTTSTYTTQKGNSYTVQRIMPSPFQMDIQVDIWTTTLDQKYQLIEQIVPLLAPGFDIQNSQNPLDWTALTTVYLEDIILSNRSIPIGGDDSLDIATIKLRLPMWLSPPAKVKAQRIIQTIITNIYDSENNDFSGVGDGTGALLGQDITTFGDYHIQVDGPNITLLNSKGVQTSDNVDYNWQDLFLKYGIFKPAQSTIYIYYTDNLTGPYVTGTLQLDPTNPSNLKWTINASTLPANTLPAINGLIDPLKMYPGGEKLPAVANGQRYLIINDIGPSQAWGNITAYANDIIQYNNGWAVAFSSRNTVTQQFVLNNYTGRQLQWTGKDWILNIDGTYGPGYWKLAL